MTLGELILIPRTVAICPYCSGDLTAQPTAIGERDDGTWEATESGVECTTIPDLDEDEPDEQLQVWHDWHAAHSVMPYVYWLPVDQIVLAWLNKTFTWEDK